MMINILVYPIILVMDEFPHKYSENAHSEYRVYLLNDGRYFNIGCVGRLDDIEVICKRYPNYRMALKLSGVTDYSKGNPNSWVNHLSVDKIHRSYIDERDVIPVNNDVRVLVEKELDRYDSLTVGSNKKFIKNKFFNG